MDIEEHEYRIILGLKAGNENSYNQLFSKYYVPLSVFANKYVKNLDTAKEIVQDLFVSIFEIRKSLTITTSLKSYLFQSVRNRCLNYIKQVQVHGKYLKNLRIEEYSETNLDDNIIEAELEYQIYKIVSQLPLKCQKIFKMSRVEGKKNLEIAKIQKISIRTVETQISKALKILRIELHDYLK